jgi:hypothetical protein
MGLEPMHRADAPACDHLARLQPLRRVAHHEGLDDQLAAAVARGDEAAGLLGRHAERLLDQDVLAGGRGALRPFDVQVVRKRDVDGLDRRIGKQGLVGAIRPCNAKRPRGVLRLSGITRRDRVDAGEAALLHRADHPIEADLRRAQNAPGDRAVGMGHPEPAKPALTEAQGGSRCDGRGAWGMQPADREPRSGGEEHRDGRSHIGGRESDHKHRQHRQAATRGDDVQGFNGAIV